LISALLDLSSALPRNPWRKNLPYGNNPKF
jgi:hypothetical protein